VITVERPDGRPVGMTANSLASVSLDPPLLSLCIERQAELHDLILAAPGFAVNILESSQEGLARRFADPHEDRFDGVGYQTGPQGEILLGSALAYIECRRYAQYPGGDHTIVVGLVIGGSTREGRPLLYYRGGYAALG
jgi:flavin reductase (DIM6/NTAB) family NADH-FMN oxidoreductase RutF